MFGGISESGLFKEPFKMEKHFNILAVAMEKLKEKALNNPLKQELKKLENEFKAVDTRKIFSKLSEILKKYFVEVGDLPEKMQPQTDRDFLDLSIEMYKLLYAKAYNMNYADDKIDDVVVKEPFMDLLLEYKFNYYGHEIFGTYGFNIVDRLRKWQYKNIRDDRRRKRNTKDIKLNGVESMEKGLKKYIILDFTGQEQQKFIIASSKDKRTLKIIYIALFEDLEALETLLKVAEQQKAEEYIIMFGGMSEKGSFKEPFTTEKHFNILIKALEKLEEKAILNPLKQDLKNLENEFDTMDTRKIFSKLLEILKKYFITFKELPEKMQPQTDKDFLDLSIEIYKLLYAKAYKTNYTSNKINDDVIKRAFHGFIT